MKKVGILTFHAAYNHGAVLQAYALKETIKKMGFESHVLNFKSQGQVNQYSIINLRNYSMSTIARNCQNLFFVNKIKRQREKFENFINTQLEVYPKEYVQEEEIKRISNEFYALICGSDQVWNNSPKMQDKNDIFFFNYDGDFKKISYAPSFGDDVNELKKDVDKIIPWIKDFDAVSVREKEGKQFLSENGINSTITIDPTLLLTREDWEKKLKKVKEIKGPYILYYSVNSRKYSINATKQIAQKMNLPVINLVLHPKSALSGFKYMIDYAPDEFLSLVKDAEFVCTNSFHGTVFSIIFEKPFVAIFDTDNDKKIIKENRKSSLLEQLELSDHMVTEYDDIDIDKIKNYDFSKAKERLNIIREDSINFLKKALGE